MRCVHVLSAASNYAGSVPAHQESAGQAYQRNDFCGVLLELMRKLFVVRDQVCNIDVAVVLLYEYVLADLVSVEENIVEVEIHDEVHQLLLHARRGGAILPFIARLAAENAD